MTKLEKLYAIIQNSKDLGLTLPEEVLKQASELEEQIIKDDIIPVIGKDIEPTLRQIQRNIVLVVDYEPNKPLSVRLSRKTVLVPDAKVYHLDNGKKDGRGKIHWDIRTDKHYEGQLMIKEVDWSTFTIGITIPMEYQFAFEHALNTPLIKGTGVHVNIWINDEKFDARISEVDFSDPKRKRCIQLLWSKKSPLSLKLRELMPKTFDYIRKEKAKMKGQKMVKLPKELQREITICSVPEHNGFLFVLNKNIDNK